MSEFPIIPGYRIEKELGQGGMARVYLAHEEKLERHVALKVLSLLTEEGRPLAERFIKEAKTSARLHHSHIITIHDVGHSGNLYYMAVEYLPGGTLKERLKQAALPAKEALQVLGNLAEALDYAHGQGFVHRDIKPENVMFRSDGRTVLTDFGIARAVGSTTRLTRTGQSIGTPHYMSPEQARGQAVDGRSDIYSLGILLHEMLTGRVPYDAEDSVAVVIQHLQDPIPTLPVPLAVYQPLLEKMMAKDPGQRFQNCRELFAAINGLLAGASPTREADRAVASPSQTPKPFISRKTIPSSESVGAQKSLSLNGDVHLQKNVTMGGKRSLLVPILIGALVILITVLFLVWKGQKTAPETIIANDTDPVEQLFVLPKPNEAQTDQANEQMVAAEKEKARLSAELKDKEENEQKCLATEASLIKKKQEEAKKQKELDDELERLRQEEYTARLREEMQKKDAEEKAKESLRFKVTLRTSGTFLTKDEVRSMVMRLGIFEKNLNPTGNFSHQYESRTISGDKVVTDMVTGLMWHQSGSDDYMYDFDARIWVDALNQKGYAGYSDWRLPTLEEGASLLESSRKNIGLYIDPLFSRTQKFVWTADSNNSEIEWVVAFDDGCLKKAWGGMVLRYVRPVRSMR